LNSPYTYIHTPKTQISRKDKEQQKYGNIVLLDQKTKGEIGSRILVRKPKLLQKAIALHS